MRALSPSVTLRESGAVLSLEEKFQGGTGVNLTPPPLEMVSRAAQEAAKHRIVRVADTLGIEVSGITCVSTLSRNFATKSPVVLLPLRHAQSARAFLCTSCGTACSFS